MGKMKTTKKDWKDLAQRLEQELALGNNQKIKVRIVEHGVFRKKRHLEIQTVVSKGHNGNTVKEVEDRLTELLKSNNDEEKNITLLNYGFRPLNEKKAGKVSYEIWDPKPFCGKVNKALDDKKKLEEDKKWAAARSGVSAQAGPRVGMDSGPIPVDKKPRALTPPRPPQKRSPMQPAIVFDNSAFSAPARERKPQPPRPVPSVQSEVKVTPSGQEVEVLAGREAVNVPPRPNKAPLHQAQKGTNPVVQRKDNDKGKEKEKKKLPPVPPGRQVVSAPELGGSTVRPVPVSRVQFPKKQLPVPQGHNHSAPSLVGKTPPALPPREIPKSNTNTQSVVPADDQKRPQVPPRPAPKVQGNNGVPAPQKPVSAPELGASGAKKLPPLPAVTRAPENNGNSGSLNHPRKPLPEPKQKPVSAPELRVSDAKKLPPRPAPRVPENNGNSGSLNHPRKPLPEPKRKQVSAPELGSSQRRALPPVPHKSNSFGGKNQGSRRAVVQEKVESALREQENSGNKVATRCLQNKKKIGSATIRILNECSRQQGSQQENGATLL